MITRYVSLILVLLLALLGTPSPLIAQTTSPPIILLTDGDLWVWSNGLTPLTHNGHVTSVAISPDGTRLAYHARSPVTLAALERVGGWSGYQPLDIHIMSIDGTDQRVAAAQPPDAVLFADDGSTNNAWVRSQVAWSPDSTQLAWTEYDIGQIGPDDTSGRLLIYNLTTAQARIVVSGLPNMQAAGPPPIDVRWITSSLVLWMWRYQDAAGNSGSAFWFYDTEGTLLEDRTITPEQFEGLNDITTISSGQSTWLGLLYRDGTHDLSAPHVNTVESYPTPPALISGHALHNSVTLTYKIDSSADFRERTIWTATYPDGDAYTLPYRGDAIAIAPDGAALAYAQDNMLVIWSRGTATTEHTGLEQIDAVIWGATTWRDGEPAYNCTALPPTRLAVGTQARVIPGTSPNNLRATFPAGDVLAQLPPGDVFTVTAGPVCMAGHHWWQVDYNGLAGWTAEGGSGEYWIEPVP